MATILVFGSSIVWGAADSEKGGWAERLKVFMGENYDDIDVYNLGISGNTSSDVLERCEFETKQRIKEDEGETIMIFAIGINDSQFNHSEKNLRTSPEKFKENIHKMIEIAKNLSKKIVFVGLTPVDESKVDPIPWRSDSSYKNEYVQKFNDIVKTTCDEERIYFIEVYKILAEKGYKKLLEDGVHPNSEGHKEIFEIVNNYLRQNKIV